MDELISEITVSLRKVNLSNLPSSVITPNYLADKITPGIVHVGVGNFHRAHQAWYLHRLMQQGKAHNWGIIGAGVRPTDTQMRDKLLAQDCLTTLIELNQHGCTAEVCGSIIGFLPVEANNSSLIKQISDPAIRIVSLTITEGGYYTNPATSEFDPTHNDIKFDINNPKTPRSVFGAIVAGLDNRRKAGINPFTVQSCDNLRGNGNVTRKAVVALAKLINSELASWIDQNVSFPNSMVDCIVPATTHNTIKRALELGIDDASPVSHENYRHWVIEDNFCAGRPEWEEVGAVFSDQIENYEKMKIRILNAGHQVLANAGELMGIDTIASCMQNDVLHQFFRKIQRDAIVPYVEAVSQMTPKEYASLIEKRFSNPVIYDTTRRVAYDGSSRHTEFVLPILRDALNANGSIVGLSLVEALWSRMCAGSRDDGSVIEDNDPKWDSLKINAIAAKTNPKVWLEQQQIYGDLAKNSFFEAIFTNWLNLIWKKGTVYALQQYINNPKTANNGSN